LLQAASRFPSRFRNGHPVGHSTVFRWATSGLLVAGERRVLLEAARVGRGLLTTEAAITRFVAAQQLQPVELATIDTSAQAAAETRLESLGV
jgi:hypothetical protein